MDAAFIAFIYINDAATETFNTLLGDTVLAQVARERSPDSLELLSGCSELAALL